MIDGEPWGDLQAITENIDEAEITCLYFPLLRQTLLLDARCNEYVGPMVRLVPMAPNYAERLRSIRRLRPQLPRPESMTSIPWMRRVESLVPLGVWEHVLGRLDVGRYRETQLETAEDCLRRLLELERTELRRAIVGGEQYETLWTAARA